MASGDRDGMIKPLSQDDPCPHHPAKMLEVFCEKCFLLICFVCSYGDHKGHPTSLASERAGFLLEELKADERELAKLKNKRSGEVTRQDQITKAYQQTLKDLKKKYDKDMEEAEKGLPEAKKEVKAIDALQQEIKKLDSSSSLATMVHLKPQVDAALGQKLPTHAATRAADSRGDVRERMRRLIPGNITKCDSSKAFHTVPPPRVMTRSYHVELFNYASGKTDVFPGAFKEPDVTTPCSWNHDVTFIRAVNAATLCAIVGGQPSLTAQRYRDRACLVHDDGTIVSCSAGLQDSKGVDLRDKAGRRDSDQCYLPASATVWDALQRYLGWRPVSVIADTVADEEPVDTRMSVKAWRDSFPGGILKIKK